jgi:hypothetical protein
MAIDENLEERVAQHRSKMRQNKAVPWLIRDDGIIMPNTPLIAKKQNFRPYHGKLDASLEDRMAYLQGLSARRRVINTAAAADEDQAFDIAKATKDELITFAQEQFGEILDPALHLNKLRADVARLAGVDPTLGQGRHGRARTEAAAGLDRPEE